MWLFPWFTCTPVVSKSAIGRQQFRTIYISIFIELCIWLFNAFLVEIDQLPNLSHLSFFIKWTYFFIKSTKSGVFYQYGYTDITKNRDPCPWVQRSKSKQWLKCKILSLDLGCFPQASSSIIKIDKFWWKKSFLQMQDFN